MSERFPLGQTVMTATAQQTLHPEDVLVYLRLHDSGNWGDLCAEDIVHNDLALKEGSRLLSSYTDRNKVKFWIITEADRSVTTVLLPEDY